MATIKSIEEKAKAYDEAIKNAHHLINEHCKEGTDGSFHRSDLQKMFPELKESKDEKIREAIYNCVRWFGYGSCFFKYVSQEECFAWLEKQREYQEYPKDVIDNAISFLANRNDGMSEEEAKDIVNAIITVLNPSYWPKQCWQKAMPKYKIGDYVKNVNYNGEPVYEIVYMDKECYICEYRGNERIGDKAVMHFSFDNPYLRLVQKPADKVEPKFKIGDWLVENEPNNYARFVQILEVINAQGKGRYRISRDIHNDEDIVEFDFVEKYYHKFDIQDAKDGDVLATEDWVFIFKKIGSNGKPVCHCHYDIELGFRIDTNSYISTGSEIYPATKEQHDLLFQKIKEAGYEWDAEKKELKKIELMFKAGDKIRRKTPSCCDKDMQVSRICNDHYICNYIGKFSSEVVPFSKQSSYELIEHNTSETEKGTNENEMEIPLSEWSEENIATISRIISIVKWAAYSEHSLPILNDEGATELVERLNFIKDSMKLQPKPDWSEEDKVMLDEIIDFFENGTVKLQHDLSLYASWLKSLKPQNRWKPSEKQMAALSNISVTGCISYAEQGQELINLYQDLKKLREE